MILLFILSIIFTLLLTILMINLVIIKKSKLTLKKEFEYNKGKNIFYSTKYAWKKNFGYTRLYDVMSPFHKMILDTENIKFYYNNKNWLITFQKGQYGIVTGAEIGIYCTNEQKITNQTIYLPCDDLEMPHMYITLYKKDKIITTINAKHWWLAIFKLGIYSIPEELSMDIVINFPTHGMLESFIQSFKELGYQKENYLTFDNTFYFKYIKPKTKQVWTRNCLIENINQYLNQKNIETYKKHLEELNETSVIEETTENNDDNISIIQEYISELVKNNKNNEEINEKIIKKIYNQNIGIM